MENFKIVLAMVVIAICFFVMGLMARQQSIEERALGLKDKDCYGWQDIEIVLFGEIQE